MDFNLFRSCKNGILQNNMQMCDQYLKLDNVVFKTLRNISNFRVIFPAQYKKGVTSMKIDALSCQDIYEHKWHNSQYFRK